MDTLFVFEKTKSRIEKWFSQKRRAMTSSTQNNFLFTTFTTLCFSPIQTILLRDLVRAGGYSIRLFNFIKFDLLKLGQDITSLITNVMDINYFRLQTIDTCTEFHNEFSLCLRILKNPFEPFESASRGLHTSLN